MTHFIKMHGLGNDFVVFDARTSPISLSEQQVAMIADRKTGIGCDQLIVMEPSKQADCFMRIYNADGSEVAACGNASRCVGELLMQEKEIQRASIQTRAGILECQDAGVGLVTVNMGQARFDWKDIPLSQNVSTLNAGIEEGPLNDPAVVSMGNPHAVFFVPDVDAVDLHTYGPRLEHHSLFPERANIEAVQVMGRGHLKLRVWERGTGETLACGTGACAAVVAGARRGLCDRKARVSLLGGDLLIHWQENGTVLMTGPVMTSFSGEIELTQYG